MTANVACLSSRRVAVNDDERFPLLRKFVTQTFPEHSKTGIHHVCTFYLLRQLHQIDILHTHGVAGVGYPPAFLVDAILSLVCDMLIFQPDLLRLYFIVFGTWLHPGTTALQPRKFCLAFLHSAGQIQKTAVAVHVNVPQGMI